MIPLAHIPGLEGVDLINGAVHPLVTLSHVLAITAVALAAGTSGEKESRYLLGGAVAGVLPGLLLPVPSGNACDLGVLAGAVAAGALTALGGKVRPPVAAIMGTWTVAWILLAGRAEADVAVFTSGAAVGMMLALLLLAGGFRSLMNRGLWSVIPRIAGSWIAAAALVNLALGRR